MIQQLRNATNTPRVQATLEGIQQGSGSVVPQSMCMGSYHRTETRSAINPTRKNLPTHTTSVEIAAGLEGHTETRQ
jgi:hypothetical protein